MLFKPLGALVLMSTISSANITGKVYKDFDYNGVFDNADTEVIGVSVVAVCDDGNSYSSATDSNGVYTLNTLANSKCRVEVDSSSVGAGAGFNATSNGTSPLVSMVDDGMTHNVSLASPATYCQASPDVVMATMPGGHLLDSSKHGTLMKVPLPKDGEENGQDTIASNRTILTVHNDTGAVWGLAWKKDSKELFMAAALRRYVPLKGDAGAIYKVDTQNENSVSLFTTIPEVTDTATNTVIGNRTYGENEDGEIVEYVGRQGLGDLDISEDNSRLYTVNLLKKELVTIDANSGDILANTVIPNPYDTECPTADVRPWALKVMGGKVYVGSICESKIEDGVGTAIQEYTGASFYTIARGNSLEYLKPKVYLGGTNDGASDMDQYHNWSSLTVYNRYRAPMFTDLEFDNKGNIVLGYADRYAWIANGSLPSSGDVRKMCKNSDGTYTDESTAVTPTDCAVTPTKYLDSDEEYYEFYIGDSYFEDGDHGRTTPLGHPETGSGALAQAPGRDNIIVGMVDATDWNEPGAIGLYSHTSGEKIGTQAVIYNDDSNNNENSAYFRKAGGMGDVELLCDAMPYLEIGNRVWNDSNGDGIQDANEDGISGEKVELWCENSKVGEATTNTNGLYYFGGIANTNMFNGNLKGNQKCQLRIKLEGKEVTIQDVNSNSEDQHDSDGDDAILFDGYSTIAFNSGTPGANNHSFDFGFSPKQTVSIGSFIWEDLNNDGLQDDGELGIADVNVTLLDENGTAMSNPVQKTLANGQYYFSGLDEGSYSVLVSPPSGMGYIPCSQQTIEDDDDTQNDSNIKITDGNNYTSGKFELQADTEPTEANGKAGTDSTDDSDDDNGNMTVDFCFYRPASLGDYVWYDNNKNGTQDAGEKGVKNVAVKLLKDCTTDAGTVTTGDDGKYLFSGLDAGDYCVEFSNLPTDYMVTTKNSGDATDATDSDASTTAPYRTDTTTLDAGEDDMTWDMGIYSSKVAIGDRVWYDLNKNGQQDDDENGVPNIEVKLLDATCSNELNTTTTDASGNYIFESLTAGTYCLGFGELEDGFVISPQDSGDNKRDSDVNGTTKKTIPVILAEGTRDLTWDMGIYAPASLGNKVWNDKNANGVQDADELPVQGVDVTLLGSDCVTAFTGVDPQETDADGLYLFEDLVAGDYCVRFTDIPVGYAISPQDKGGDNTKDSDVNVTTGVTTVVTLNAGDNDPTWDMGIYKPATIGNVVWNDLNGNGEQEDGEMGVENVNVTLFNCDCTTIATDNAGVNIPNTVTDANGVYSFTELRPNDYCVGFTVPTGYVVSPQSATADDSKDSDVNSETNATECTTLSSDENDTTWDMGIYEPASIGDRVWYDTNRDGVQDSGELGVPNAMVTLYQPDGVTVVETTKTDEDGNFLFDELVPNDYRLGFDVPSGYALSDDNKTNDNNDSDANPLTGQTDVTNLESGENDISWDAGIYQLSTLGDKVWYDENHNGIQDINEPAVKDVKVVLYESDCETAISETRSDANGQYLFADLEPKEYCVGFEELPVGYQFTPNYDNTGAGSELDCNVDPGTGKTPVITLPHATNDMTWDMGIIPKCKDEEDRVLRVFDDNITASTTGSVTTVNILANDHGNLDIESIRFVDTTEGAILWENGTAVGGTSLKTTDKLVVKGEGNWTISNDGTVSFKAEDGFIGVPTLVYYIINCKEGSTSNVGQVKITSNCVCDTYEESMSDSVPVFSKVSMVLVLVLTSFLGLFFFRRELAEIK